VNSSEYDVIVVGSGVGGCCAAVLQAYQGKKVLLLEKRRYLGGRFSTVDHGGYKCATGGLGVLMGLNMEQVCNDVGIQSGAKASTKTATWLDGKFYDHKKGVTRKIIQDVADTPEEAERVVLALNRAMKWDEPSNAISFREWLNQYTSNEKIHGMFQSTIGSLLTVNSNELPAGEYFKVIKAVSPLTFGYIEGGSLTLWEKMAELIKRAGGEVLLAAPVQEVLVDKHMVSGVVYQHKQEVHQATAPIVISNMGPTLTASMVDDEFMERSYLELLAQIQPTAIMWLHFSSDELLMDYSALGVGCTRAVVGS